MSRIVIVTGPPGAGKSTVARRLARSVEGPLALHLHTDDFYAYVQKGFIAPWKPESQAQNITLMNAMAAAARTCAEGGYDVFVDGVVGSWFLEPWLVAGREGGVELHYVALLPDPETAVARGVARTAPGAMTDAAVIRQMCEAFQRFPPPPGSAPLDTTGQTPAETAAAVAAGLAEGRFRLV